MREISSRGTAYSPYIEQKSRELPEPGESDRYLKKLKSLRYLMILYKLGYGDRMMTLAYTNLKKAYPEAHEAFKKDLEGGISFPTEIVHLRDVSSRYSI